MILSCSDQGRTREKRKKDKVEKAGVPENDRCIFDVTGTRHGVSLLVYLYRFSISATVAKTIDWSGDVFSIISKRI